MVPWRADLNGLDMLDTLDGWRDPPYIQPEGPDRALVKLNLGRGLVTKGKL